jgi:hypothetical protein
MNAVEHQMKKYGQLRHCILRSDALRDHLFGFIVFYKREYRQKNVRVFFLSIQ